MKNAKLGFFALLGLVGLASAFSNAPNKSLGSTYYVITDGANGYTYTLSTSLLCRAPKAGVTSPYCTVQTTGGYTPIANTPIPPANVASFTHPNDIHR
ncbi:hypothetical protein [Chitinophaga tropicalis]|uniref:Uncharacterized protein n=1 Tax=Chitinophaga tropicalis TaxID=2683588 RepID=A0A7K1U0Z4_9BACT|nr:hypothetical protein [Chitinophaga tropicalis]MVT07665.1 hypothetical protein [Chitinophaga tropicalis]